MFEWCVCHHSKDVHEDGLGSCGHVSGCKCWKFEKELYPPRYTKHNNPCIEKAEDDEPIFVLRATDMSSTTMIAHWIKRNWSSLSPEKIRAARDVIISMWAWQQRNSEKVKRPD